mmetsp:Transcript_17546/g.39646  ORF Transcript_17546/g.39646 Transcript_17546/m.39646 type:complete len:359 (-) Transcript_17546:2122-3198(-)
MPDYKHETDIRIKYLEYSRSSFPLISSNFGSISFHVPTFAPPLPGTEEDWTTDAPALPLLRRLGPDRTIRVLSALLSERRVLIVGQRASVVSSCVMALAAMLGHGSLAWQHFILPIVPPNMLTYVSAPMPYLIGMLQAHTRMLGNIQDIGEFLLVNVDKTGADALMVYNSSDEVNYAPDILTQTIRFDQPSNQLNFAGVELKNTFEDILKCDYRVWATTGIQGAVTKASDLGKKVYEGFKIIRKKSKGSKNSREQVERNASYEDFGDEDDQGNNVSVYVDFENEKCEVRIRLALVAFFLDLYGNPRFYLSRNDSNQLVVDKRKFIVEKEKRMSGVDPLLCLLEPFSEVSMQFTMFTRP